MIIDKVDTLNNLHIFYSCPTTLFKSTSFSNNTNKAFNVKHSLLSQVYIISRLLLRTVV